jgi:hypothetical protein
MGVLDPFTTSEKSILERFDASLFEDAAEKSSFHTASTHSRRDEQWLFVRID